MCLLIVPLCNQPSLINGLRLLHTTISIEREPWLFRRVGWWLKTSESPIMCFLSLMFNLFGLYFYYGLEMQLTIIFTVFD